MGGGGGGGVRGGRGGEEEGGVVGSQDQGLYHCPTCRQDLGTTTALFLHLQTGGGRCPLAPGITFQEFRGQFRQRQIKILKTQKVSHGWGC